MCSKASHYFQVTTAFGVMTGEVKGDALYTMLPHGAPSPQLKPLCDEGAQPFITALQALLQGEEPPWWPRLVPQGSAFQQQVWQALQQIPRGEVRTYGEIAKAIGASSKAARAVGAACGANPIALFIPCHRVVRSDGGLGGFAWGLPLKQHLLAVERYAPVSYP